MVAYRLSRRYKTRAAPLEELWTPRSTEYDSWKFIYEDLKFAMANMAEESVTGTGKSLLGSGAYDTRDALRGVQRQTISRR